MDQSKPTPIEVNLRLPDESNSGSGLADIIRFIWSGRKTILICTLVGILVGIAVAGVYYSINKAKENNADKVEVAEVNTGVATATLQYVFPEAEQNRTPSGESIKPTLILSNAVMNRAAEILGNIIAPDILRNDFNIEYFVTKNGEYDYPTVVLTHTIGAGSEWLNTGLPGDAGLTAVIQAYKEYCNKNYSYEKIIEADVNKMLRDWDDCFNWDSNVQDMEYNDAFNVLEKRYRSILNYVCTLYAHKPNFEHGGLNLNDFYRNMQQNCDDIIAWRLETYNHVYLNEIEAFKNTAQERITWLNREMDVLAITYDRYVLISPNVAIIEPNIENPTVFNITYEDKRLADRLYDYENQASWLNRYLELLSDDGNMDNIMGDTAKADNAVAYFTHDLDINHDNGSLLVRAYYEEYYNQKINPPDDMVIVSRKPVFKQDILSPPVNALKSSQMLMLFIVCSAFGFSLGIAILYTKKILLSLKTA